MQEGNTRTWALELLPDGEVAIEADMAAVDVLKAEPGSSPRVEAPADAEEWLEIDVDNRAGSARIRVHWRQPALSPSSLLEWFAPRKAAMKGLKIFVPDGIGVRVTAEAGKVALTDLDLRRLDVTANAGVITLRGIHADMHVRANAGKIDGEGLSGLLDVAATSGAVRLRLDALDPGESEIRADVGAVTVELPRGAEIELQSEANLGAVRSEFSSTPGAPALLRVAANVGSVRVREFAAATAERPRKSVAVATRPAPAASKAPPDEEVERVLKMVEEGWLSANDAADLLKAMGGR